MFTNGVFDILHPGHVYLLKQSKALGDKLIVGINSDLSAAALGKWPKRPFQKVMARKILLEANRYVDQVHIFYEQTPLELIQKIKPDILVKGGDYKEEEVVGKNFVESYGGRVVLVPYLENESTTKIIHRVLRENKYQQHG